ncbi:MAG: HAD-IC family P-type ATPase, partial [Betaproteobacteria bacterium]
AAFAGWLWIDASRALGIAVAVLIVTCPCALALATPTAVTVATGAMARHNFAVTRGRAIEALAGVTDVVFDKTGTLTLGAPALLKIVPFGGNDRGSALALAATLAQGSSHPFDRALRRACPDEGILPANAYRSTPGGGIEAVIDGRRVRLGSAAYAGALHSHPPCADVSEATDSINWLADERGSIAAFSFGDGLRPGAADLVGALRRSGIAVHLLSGDDPDITGRVAAALGIDHVRGGATPEEKCGYVRDLQQGGGRVAMVGDGINDAPVIAQADVSIAMQSGADIAKVRADAVLVSDSPDDLAAALRIARKARAVIRQNLAWAFGYNLIVIPLAITGQLSPLIAGLGMSMSSLLVVANSLRAR